jgi:DNA polymerase III epsilon subunit family exonuclease
VHASARQREAIEAPLGPVLVVAGPGAGKTFCLIGRIRYLVAHEGVPPERICAVTFTNKAAEEVAARLADVLAHRAGDVKRGTIHALCAEVLREHAEAAGLRPGFGIASDDYQETVLRRLGQWRRARQLLLSFSRHRLQDQPLTPGDEALLADYLAQLRRRNMVDFDDLVVLTRRLFARDDAIAGSVAARWDHLLVDEFQDVNAAQYAILRRLAEPHRNLFAVGDDEQSIFAFAGANPRVLTQLQRDFGIAAPIVLERNHRSSQQIFGVARRLLRANPSLFEKELEAPRQSVHPVRAVSFADDEAEAAWIIADIARDRATHQLGWGDYAVLYRRHETGERLEGWFVRAGVPCRLARGRPLEDDPVIGYVITALRLLRSPGDTIAAEAFARRVLPPHLLERVQAELTGERERLLPVVRDLAESMRGDPDAKKLWRFIYQVENLAGLRRSHGTLWGLVLELLSQRVGPYRNALEDEADQLADPAELPAATALAGRLGEARRARARVVLEAMGGLEIALRGLLFEAGFRLVRYAQEIEQTEFDDCVIGPDDGGTDGLAYTAFKALQLLASREVVGGYQRYVTFDLETTDLDPRTCDVVEIGAVRVVQGRIVEQFRSLVRPERPITAGARRTHGITDEEVAGAPPFAEVWPRFLSFVGKDPLVAHNAQRFDVPVLRRLAEPLGGAERLVCYDTLPLANAVCGDSAKLTALAERFGVPVLRAHRALEDATTLVHVYEALERLRRIRARTTALVHLLSHLGLALVLDRRRRAGPETDVVQRIASRHALGRYSDCLDHYEAERARVGAHAPALEEVIERLGGRRAMERMRQEPDPARRYPAALARLQALVEQHPDEPLEAALDRFLDRVALSTSKGAEVGRHGVNLLTLHSTKGLEFSRVYIVGVEDEQLPGFVMREQDADENCQESRRLLYVGMTRAIDRLVLTRTERRADKPSGGTQFLDEMQLEAVSPEALPEPA